jgi:hypothetical protein
MKANANLSLELKGFQTYESQKSEQFIIPGTEWLRTYESQKSEQLLSLEPNGSRPMKPSLFIPGIL